MTKYRWCPKGCGKKIYYVKEHKSTKPFYCEVCEKTFTKLQVMKKQKGSS
jgi:sulfatase maturation enzyme AslB (radical SAM superfamily)